MRAVTVTTTIDAPREVVFDYLADIANHAEFTDHFLKDFRLERLDSRGVGAAASFRVESALARLPLARPLASLWGELAFTEMERPYRIVSEGRAGRIGRIKLTGVYTLIPHDHGMTKVEFTFSSESHKRADRLRELIGGRLWLRLMLARALRRLKFILERGEPSVARVRVAPG
jgi:uncharacterized protein YndB with AHSA1/START domain